MFKNYNHKKSKLFSFAFFKETSTSRKNWVSVIAMLTFFFLIATELHAQTTIINPATDGGFNSGNSFSANGWTVSNGDSAVKWFVGTNANQGVISGNSAYVSIDNGATNSYFGFGASTVYFYKDVTVPAGETNIALQFDWRCVGNNNANDSWHVLVAPTATIPVGSANQTAVPPSVPSDLTGAISLDYGFNSNNGSTVLFTPVVQTAYITIPDSYAGTTFRLIFMWTNDLNNGNNPAASIDNISLVSRTATSYVTNASGNYSNPLIWTPNGVPSGNDNATISAGHTVVIDGKGYSSNNFIVDGTLSYSTISDQYSVNGNLTVNTAGVFSIHAGTTAKILNTYGNIIVNGRLDTSIGTLNLKGSTVQTVGGTGILGGTVTSATNTNTAGMIANLTINNSNSATPNVIWNFNNIRIRTGLSLTNARVALGSNKMIVGNYNAANIFTTIGNGFISGTVGRWFTTSTTGTAFTSESDYTTSTGLFPFISPTGDNRWGFVVRSNSATSGNTAGEVNMNYNDASTVSTASIVDGSYTITNRYDANWTVSTVGTYAYASGTHSVGFYANNAFNVQNGNSRITNSLTAAGGSHLTGTVTPFMQRIGLSTAQLTADAFYVGYNTADLTNRTSVTSGDWNNPATWGGSIPTCSDFVTIASGHVVSVNSAANVASGVNILLGGSLVNTSGDLTVGCTNNNATFSNFGTNTVIGGVLKVNGNVIHNTNSTFNHTGGDIIVDGNNNGNPLTSVSTGKALFKISTSTLNLAGGKITLVDPLVNSELSSTQSSFVSTNLSTQIGTTQVGNLNSSTTVTLSAANVAIVVGMNVTGNGIAPGTYVSSISGTSLTLSTAALSSLPSVTLTFSAIALGSDKLRMNANASTLPIFQGQSVSGTGIAPGTTVLSFLTFGALQPMITLSQPANATISSVSSLTFGGMTSGANGVLSSTGAAISSGQYVLGNGIQPGTTVSSYSTTTGLVTLSNSATTTISSTETLTFYAAPNSVNDLAFVYTAPAYYAANLEHTLQIGDGISIEKGVVTTTGFSCNFGQSSAGNLSLGNLTINALDGENRFFNFIGNLNVQNNMNVTQGTFKRGGTIYFGGNVINNGTMFTDGIVNLSNYIDGAATSTPLPQTISGTGVFYNNQTIASATGAVNTLNVNNTNPSGVSIAVPNFRVVSTITMTSGIIHTSTANPLQHGVAGSTIGAGITGNFSNSCFIDGPYEKNFGQNQSGALQIFPVGKGSSFLPIWMGLTTTSGQGASFKAEAFTTNTGTTSTAINNLSQIRWEIPLTTGVFTDYLIQVGNPSIASNNIIVEAPTAAGIYTNSLGNFASFTAGIPNTLSQLTANPSANFAGYISTSTQADCTLVNPGDTIASNNTICAAQPVTLSLQNSVLGNGISYQWQVSTDGGTTYSNLTGATEVTYTANPTLISSYRCNVTCSFASSTVASNPVTILFSNSISATPISLCSAGIATLTASAPSGTINWYDAATNGTILATGTTYAPTITSTTTYYVQSDLQTNYTTGGSYSGTSSGGVLYSGQQFDVSNTMILNSVTVYPAQTVAAANDPITIALFDSNGIQVPGTSAITFVPNVKIGSPATSSSQIVTLNYTIPAGTGYRLLTTYGLNTTNKLGIRTSGVTQTSFGAVTMIGRVSSLTGGTPSATSQYNFFDWAFTEICASPRIAVTATVTQTVAPTGNAIQEFCATANPSIAQLAAVGTNILWYDNATSGNLLNSTTLLIDGNHYYASQTVAGCESSTRLDVLVTLVANPSTITITPSPANICVNAIQPLVATSSSLPIEATIGTGTTLSGSTSQPTAFCNRWPNYWSQTIYTAAELTAAGLTAGNINSLAYNINTLGDAATNANLKVMIGTSTASSFASTTFENTALYTTVYGPSTYTHTATGWQTITFTTPYVWDGTSNIVINMTHDGADSVNNSQTYYTVTPDNKTIWKNSYTSSTTTGSLSVNRLNIKLISGSTALTWLPVTNLFLDANANVPYLGQNSTTVYVKSNTAGTTTYTATATNATGCLTTQTVNVTVASLPVLTITDPIAVCSPATVDITNAAITSGSDTGITLTYYTDSMATIIYPTPTAALAGTYYIKAENAAGCSTIAPVNVSVNSTPSALSINPASPIALCSQTVQSLSVIGGNISATATIGTGTTLSGSTSQPTAFCNRWPNYWSQTIYTAAELTAAGLTAGNINSLAYNINTLGDAATNANLKVMIGTSTASSFASTTFENTALYTTVYGPSTYTHTATGWQTITFTTPYVWDGTSNIVINMTHDGADSANNSQTYYTVTPDNKTIWKNSYTSSTTTGSFSVNRLNIRLAASLNALITWLPVTDLYTDAMATVPYTGQNSAIVYVKSNTAGNTTYTATAASASSTCTATTTVDVNINVTSAPTAAAMQDACATATIADFIVSGTAGANFTFYSDLAGTTILPTNATAIVGTTYYVSQTVNGCEGPKTAILANGPCLGNRVYELVGLEYYPNPVINVFTISAKENIRKVEVYNLVGQMLMSKNLDALDVAINFENLPTSTYIVKVFSNDKTANIKVVKK